MKNYKEIYSNLSDGIKKREEKMQSLNGELKENNKKRNDLTYEGFKLGSELFTLKNERQEIITKKDRFVAIPAGLLMAGVTAGIVFLGTQITGAVASIFLKVIVVMLSLSLGGCLDLILCALIGALSNKIKKKLHEKIMNTNTRCIQLSKTISDKEQELKKIEHEKSNILTQIATILEKIKSEESAIMIDKQDIERIEREIIDLVLETSLAELQETRPYTKIKTPDSK